MSSGIFRSDSTHSKRNIILTVYTLIPIIYSWSKIICTEHIKKTTAWRTQYRSIKERKEERYKSKIATKVTDGREEENETSGAQRADSFSYPCTQKAPQN